MIQFSFQKKISLVKRNQLKNFICKILKKEKLKAGNINIIFCSDNEILSINKQYLKHHYFTDIITFDLSENRLTQVDADIFISVDTVRSNAQRFSTTQNRELHRVIFHGILHLCGYNDKTKAEQTLMRKKEEYNLSIYFS